MTFSNGTVYHLEFQCVYTNLILLCFSYFVKCKRFWCKFTKNRRTRIELLLKTVIYHVTITLWMCQRLHMEVRIRNVGRYTMILAYKNSYFESLGLNCYKSGQTVRISCKPNNFHTIMKCIDFWKSLNDDK